MTISLMPDKTRVIVIGGGRAGFIKAKAFSKRGCRVFVLSREFMEEFRELEDAGNVTLIRENYDKSYIIDKHIVVIATDNEELNNSIKKNCEDLYKIYLTCSDFEKGMFITPVQGETEEINFSVHTRSGSPRTSVFIAHGIQEYLKEYDGFVKYICSLRKSLKGFPMKDEIMKLVNTKEFYEKYKAGKYREFIENILK